MDAMSKSFYRSLVYTGELSKVENQRYAAMSEAENKQDAASKRVKELELALKEALWEEQVAKANCDHLTHLWYEIREFQNEGKI